jgi:MoaA/NifB/PqqE/SkfB family radical SAM enzyme
MINIKKQYDEAHKVERLYVHWDVSTQCQLKCSYCYSIKDYGNEWGKVDSWTRQKLVIHNISRSSLPVFLGLLGGEPTIHAKYDELIEECHRAISKHKDGRLYITTNGVKNNKWFQEHKYYANTSFLWSMHFEYEKNYGKDFSKFINNIKTMKEKGFRNKVNVMLSPKKELWPKIHRLVDLVERIGGVEIHPHFLYEDGDVHELHKYTDEFWIEFKRFKEYPGYFVYESDSEKNVYNDYEVFLENKTKFKGWSCWNNNYEITYDGQVNKFCFDEKSDLTTDINFFKNIHKVNPKKCPHNSCNCDGLLKIFKRNDSIELEHLE